MFFSPQTIFSTFFLTTPYHNHSIQLINSIQFIISTQSLTLYSTVFSLFNCLTLCKCSPKVYSDVFLQTNYFLHFFLINPYHNPDKLNATVDSTHPNTLKSVQLFDSTLTLKP